MKVVPESPVMSTVRLYVSQIESQTLSDVQHIAKVQADDVEEDRGHADLIKSPNVLSTPRVVWLPPAELDPKFTSPRRKFYRNNSGRKK